MIQPDSQLAFPVVRPTDPTQQWLVRLAWALFGLLVGLDIAGVMLHVRLHIAQQFSLLAFLYVAVCGLVGVLIIAQRPTNSIGWLLLCGGLLVLCGFVATRYGLYALYVAPWLPAANVVGWTAAITTPIGSALLVVLLPMVFPNGRLLSPRWRLVGWLCVVLVVVMTLARAFAPGLIQDTPGLVNPFAVVLPQAVAAIIGTLSVAGFALVLLLGALSLLLRYRRATGEEQQQLRWLTYAIIAWCCSVVLSFAVEAYLPAWFPLADALVLLTLTAIPAAIGLAVLRYQLYDIDQLISRALVYGGLTFTVAGVYVLVVAGVGWLLQVQGSPLVSLLAAGLAAAGFGPVRTRLQRGVNRLLYGNRDEPYTALAELGRRLETSLLPEAVLPTIVQTVAEALRLPYAAIMLPPHHGAKDAAEQTAAEHGLVPAWSTSLIAVPLAFQGEHVGRLVLAPRAPNEAFTGADWRLLHDLARQAGAAVHTVQLTRALQAGLHEVRRSRERLVLAQEEERRRIQRDLHDGLGPVLASMRLRLEVCLDQAQESAPAMIESLERLDSLVGQASSDIRRLVHDLRPPALDQLGLGGALRQHLERFSRETRVVVQFEAAELALPAATEVTIYRIVHEALNNVHKHAAAHEVRVQLMLLGDAIMLHIGDDGVGGAEDHPGGTGLASMRERAEMLGGTLALHSPPGHGTRVEVYLPTREQADERTA